MPCLVRTSADTRDHMREKNMYCTQCGRELRETDRFCAYCGAPVSDSDDGAARHPDSSGRAAQTSGQTGGAKGAHRAAGQPPRKRGTGKKLAAALAVLLVIVAGVNFLPNLLNREAILNTIKEPVLSTNAEDQTAAETAVTASAQTAAASADDASVQSVTASTETAVAGAQYQAEENGISADAEDNTDALQALIDRVWQAGGGEILFGAGTFKFKSVNCRSQVSFRGQGEGATFLMRISDDSVTSKGFLYFDQYATAGHIKDLTIVGRDMTTLTDGKMGTEHFPEGYFTADGMAGIYYEQGQESYSSTFVDGEAGWAVQGLLTSGRTFAEGDIVAYKFATLDNIMVMGFPGYGIYIGPYIFCFTINNVSIEQCGCGFYCASSDTIMSNMLIEGSAYDGALIAGGNLKISNMKSIWNGAWTTLEDRKSPFVAADPVMNSILEKDDDCWGIQLQASRSSVTNIEVQDNYCSGIFLNGVDLSATGIISDSNGLVNNNPRNNWGNDTITARNGDTEAARHPRDCYGIKLKGTRCYYQVKNANYKYSNADQPRHQPCRYSLYIDWCRYSDISWTDQSVDNAWDAALNPGLTVTDVQYDEAAESLEGYTRCSASSVTPLLLSDGYNLDGTTLNGVDMTDKTVEDLTAAFALPEKPAS